MNKVKKEIITFIEKFTSGNYCLEYYRKENEFRCEETCIPFEDVGLDRGGDFDAILDDFEKNIELKITCYEISGVKCFIVPVEFYFKSKEVTAFHIAELPLRWKSEVIKMITLKQIECTVI